MHLVISPAKTLDYTTPPTVDHYTLPHFLGDATRLIDLLRPQSTADIAQLMSLSDNLAELNVARYRAWHPAFTPDNAKQAVLAFAGDVYDGLDATSLTADDLAFAQQHLRILSGLYGLLRPLDLIQPYRLEMGTRLAGRHGKDLYAFWGDRITAALSTDLHTTTDPVLINLASEEYFKAVRPAKLAARVITPVFEDWKNGRYKVISFFAKRARGLMARYAMVQRLQEPSGLKDFALAGYQFDAADSTADTWIFRRRDYD